MEVTDTDLFLTAIFVGDFGRNSDFALNETKPCPQRCLDNPKKILNYLLPRTRKNVLCFWNVM